MKKIIYFLCWFTLGSYFVWSYYSDGFDSPVAKIENYWTDAKFKFRGPEKRKDFKTVILAIDDESVQKFGRWPWPRDTWVKVLEELQKYEIKALAFDILFTSNSEMSLYSKKFPDLIPDQDKFFADAVKNYQDNNSSLVQVILGVSASPYEKLDEEQQKSALAQALEVKKPIKVRDIEGEFMSPYTELASEVRHYGAIKGMRSGSDGLTRSTSLVYQISNKYFLSLAMKAFEQYLEDQFSIDETNVDKNGEYFNFKGLNTKFTGDIENGKLNLWYYGGAKTIPTIGISEFLSDSDSLSFRDSAGGIVTTSKEAFFKDKAIFIGATAESLEDLRAQPFDIHFPGVEIHATALENLIRKDFLRLSLLTTVPYSMGLLLVTLFLTTLLSATLTPKISLPANFLVYGGSLAIDYYYFFNYSKILVPTLSIVLVAFFSDFLLFMIRFVIEEKKKNELKNAFSHYLAPDLVDQIANDVTKLSLGGTKKHMTIMFTDFRDFTSMSEKLEPTQLSKLLNLALGQITEIIYRYRGTVDKYIGDAVMAFWGAPLDVEDHETKAIQCALEIIEAMDKLNKDVVIPQFGVELKIGIGLNTQEVFVGNMGSDFFFNYTVMGDGVNLASRLEGLCKPYGVQLIVSESTGKVLFNSSAIKHRLLDDGVQVKGKKEPAKIYEFKTELTLPEQRIFENYSQAFEAYKKGNFSESIAICDRILEKESDGPTLYLKERSTELQTQDPQEWTGVWKMKTK